MAGNLGLATGSRRDAFTCLQVLPDSARFRSDSLRSIFRETNVAWGDFNPFVVFDIFKCRLKRKQASRFKQNVFVASSSANIGQLFGTGWIDGEVV